MKLYSPSTIKEIRDKYGFRFSKSLGQNFLTDKNIIDQIIEGSEIGPEDMVLEIGPGIGVITSEAADIAKKVTAIEIDSDLIPILQETVGFRDNVEIINADILKTDIKGLIAGERENLSSDARVRVIGNLPYYITTPIIMKLLQEEAAIDTITVMMQKEVADRLKASPATKEFGAISLMVQYYAEVKEIVKVPKTVFVPQPKVDSMVLRLDLRDEPPVSPIDRDFMFSVIKAGFSLRRKTLANSLATLKDYSKEEVVLGLNEAGIDPVRRGETLSLEEYAKLSDVLYKMHRE